MARIKIKDLPKDMKITREEMKKICGGGGIFDMSSVGGTFAIGFRQQQTDNLIQALSSSTNSSKEADAAMHRALSG
jgi:hypothetical protein